MKQKVYGKVYDAKYKIAPLLSYSSYAIQDRIDNPDEYIQVEYEHIRDVLLYESKATKIYLIGDLIEVDGVFHVIERKEVKNDIAKYYTNCTFETLLPTNIEYEKLKKQIVSEAANMVNTTEKVVNINQKFYEEKGRKTYQNA